MQTINKSDVDHIGNAEKNQNTYLGGQKAIRNSRKSFMISAEMAKKGNDITENILDKKNQNLEEKDLVKELNKNSNRNPTKEQKKEIYI